MCDCFNQLTVMSITNGHIVTTRHAQIVRIQGE